LLYQGNTDHIPHLSGFLKRQRADSVYRECQGAAEHIVRLIHSGCRFRDIGVVCADLPAYQDTLRLVFGRCGLPLYMSGTEDILQKTVITSVLSAVDAALGGLEQRGVLSYLKSALSPIDPDTCDQVENYAILWGIRGSRWQQPWENHPDGLGEEWTDAARARLASLEQARCTALEPLLRLRRGFRNARVLCDQVQALYGFFEDIRLAQRLSTMADEMERRGNYRDAQILNQIWEILQAGMKQAMEQLVAMRVFEGQKLVEDISARVDAIEKTVDKIETRSPQVEENYRKRLDDRLAELLPQLPI